MVVKTGNFRFFSASGGIPYYDYFCKSFRGNGMDLYKFARKAIFRTPLKINGDFLRYKNIFGRFLSHESFIY